MCEQLRKDFFDAAEAVPRHARWDWFDAEYNKTNLSLQDFAKQIDMKSHTTVLRWLQRERPIAEDPLARITVALVNLQESREVPGYRAAAPPSPTADDLKVGGYLRALHNEADRARVAARLDAFRFYCLYEMTRDGLWTAAARANDPKLVREVVNGLLTRAGERARRIRYTLPPAGADTPPADDPPCDRPSLQALQRTWKGPWARLLDCFPELRNPLS